MLTVRRVEPKDLLPVWNLLLPQIRKGLKRGHGETLREDWLFRATASGEVVLWVVLQDDEIKSTLFLRTEERKLGTALIVTLSTAGRDGKYPHDFNGEMLKRLREYGDMLGAYTIESSSRLGAAKVLMRYGCKPKAMIMELRDEQRSSNHNIDRED